MYSTIIVAVSTDGFIADSTGTSLKTSPEDTALLKTYLTKFGVHIMGRKTFETHAPKHITPNKQRIVLTSTPDMLQKKYGAVAMFTNAPFKDIIASIHEPFLILGGASIYELALRSGAVSDVVVVTEPFLLKKGTPFLHTTTLEDMGYYCDKERILSASGTSVRFYTKKLTSH